MPYGVPKTDAERKERHKQIYGNENIPERGYQFQNKSNCALIIAGSVIVGVVVCLLGR